MRYEYIRSMKLAATLMLKGFRICAVQKDKYNPAFDVYIFKKSSELSSAIKEYSASGGKENGINNKRSRNTNQSEEYNKI